MRVSLEQLAADAEATGFRADMLEKVAHLLGLLEAIQRHPFLKGKLALRGERRSISSSSTYPGFRLTST